VLSDENPQVVASSWDMHSAAKQGVFVLFVQRDVAVLVTINPNERIAKVNPNARS